jgi:hypothetical protein
MPLLLRKIGAMAYWVAWDELHTDPDFSWLREDQRPADTLADLRTKQNKMSLWEIDDNRDNLPDVLAAIALSNRQNELSEITYVLFEYDDLAAVCPNIAHTPGDTPCPKVNDLYHRDVSCLSGHDLLALTSLDKALARCLPADLLPHMDRLIAEGEAKAPKADTKLSQSMDELRRGLTTVRNEAV